MGSERNKNLRNPLISVLKKKMTWKETQEFLTKTSNYIIKTGNLF